MKVKRYIGSSIQEVMRKVKRELGSDAIILHTRDVKQPGLLGFFKKSLIEVVVAIEEKNMESEYLSKPYNMTKDNNIVTNKNHFSSNKDDLEDEIIKIRTMVEKVANTLDANKKELPEVFSFYFDSLIDNGVNRDVAFQILDRINQQINISNKDRMQVEEIILYSIRDYLGESSPITYDGRQKVIFFIGPTGVGKTTTLAKIAADFSINKNLL